MGKASISGHNLPEGCIAHNIDDWVGQFSQPVDGVGGNVSLVAEFFIGESIHWET